jgi:hypothetical protein
MIENEEGYTLHQDNDSHWYVIPADKVPEWEEFLELDPDDPESWDAPEWAEAVGGSPSLVIFNSYQVG